MSPAAAEPACANLEPDAPTAQRTGLRGSYSRAPSSSDSARRGRRSTSVRSTRRCRRHERDGYVNVSIVEQADRPDKKVYALTEAGREALRGWLEGPARTTKLRDQFFLKFLLAADTGLVNPFELLERQRAAALRALRDLSEGSLEDDRGDAALLVEGAALHLQADIRWLDRCEDYLASREPRERASLDAETRQDTNGADPGLGANEAADAEA